MTTCKSCGRPGLQRSNDKYALNTWTKEGGDVVLNAGNFLPLQGFICSYCGEITFKVDKDALS